MLGILLIYFVGRAFYRLAKKYGKSKWGFAILGVASYYGGLLLGSFCIGLYLGYTGQYSDSSIGAWALLGIPIGILCCVGLYMLLKRAWDKQATIESSQILDDELLQ